MKEVSLVFAIEELAIFVSLVTNFLKIQKEINYCVIIYSI